MNNKYVNMNNKDTNRYIINLYQYDDFEKIYTDNKRKYITAVSLLRSELSSLSHRTTTMDNSQIQSG